MLNVSIWFSSLKPCAYPVWYLCIDKLNKYFISNYFECQFVLCGPVL